MQRNRTVRKREAQQRARNQFLRIQHDEEALTGHNSNRPGDTAPGGHIPGANFAFLPITSAGAAGGGASASETLSNWENPGQITTSAGAAIKNVSSGVGGYGTGLFNMPMTPGPLLSSLPVKRPPSMFANEEALYVPEGTGQIPPTETADTGFFKSQPTVNPQKTVVMTYEAGKDTYSDCRVPLKINIPPGDYGLYKVIVNEVLFRNDAPLIDGTDYFDIEISNYQMYPTFLDPDTGKTFQLTEYPLFSSGRVSASSHFTIPDFMKLASYSYLDSNLFIPLLTYMAQHSGSNTATFTGPRMTQENITAHPIEVNGVAYMGTIQDDPDHQGTQLIAHFGDLVDFVRQESSGNGMYIRAAHLQPTHRIQYSATLTDTETKYLIDQGYAPDVASVFKFSCSNHLRNILMPLATVREIQAKQILVQRETTQIYQNKTSLTVAYPATYLGIEIPVLNFAGPTVFMLNTNIQTTCPIANDAASQFKTCALSYNTDIIPYQLVQMTSNIPLILQEGSDFRVSLVDLYGNPVRLKSPMYIQVTITPFSNASIEQMVEAM